MAGFIGTADSTWADGQMMTHDRLVVGLNVLEIRDVGEITLFLRSYAVVVAMKTLGCHQLCVRHYNTGGTDLIKRILTRELKELKQDKKLISH